jgi:hypothetical protein
MPTASFILFVAIVLSMFAVAIDKPQRMLEYPYFMAVVFGGFIGVQGAVLVRFPGSASDEWIAKALFTACLCLVMCAAGYRTRGSRTLIKIVGAELRPERLFRGGVVLLGISYVFIILTSATSIEERARSQWTGKLTIYAFFAQLAYPAFGICLQTALRYRTRAAWVATIASAVPAVLAVMLAGRREPAITLIFTIAFMFFLFRQMRLSRVLTIFVILAATICIPLAGEYRTLVDNGGIRAVAEFNPVAGFLNYTDDASILELRNAALLMEAVEKSGRYRLGMGYWDNVVFRFVPAQILGKDFKDKLMFEPSGEEMVNRFESVGYTAPVGSTITGIADSFTEFGYFGCLIFAVMGSVLKSIWLSLYRCNGNSLAPVVYTQISVAAMISVTHQTYNFAPTLIYYALFLTPVALYARKRTPTTR